jgi:hypothetical protein
MTTLNDQEARPTSRRGVQALIAGAVVVVLLAVGYVLLHRGADKAPYDDAAAVGRLTLCDASGNAVTKGKIDDRPFVATVVGSTAAPSTYVGNDSQAVVIAHQPRKGVGADGWTGLQLSVGTTISEAAHPVSSFTAGDTTLRQFIGGYPAEWDGWVQLRLILTGPGAPATESYDAVDLHIDGDTWTAADPGTAPCPQS